MNKKNIIISILKFVVTIATAVLSSLGATGTL